jgi:diguanylate cyclase (GGDEF)-like protein/PAS domain S-box-containing protein
MLIVAEGSSQTGWIMISLAVLAGLAALFLARANWLECKRANSKNELAEDALNALSDAILEFDATGKLTFTNASGEAILGIRSASTDSDSPRDDWQFIDHLSRTPLLSTLFDLARKEGLVKIPIGARLINRHGIELEVEGDCQPLRDQSGEIRSYLLHLRDVTEEREWQRQQPDLWDRDPVTTLPGRSFIENRVDRILQSRRAGDLPMSYIYVPIEGVREVYGQAGNQAGDALLRLLTGVLRSQVRDTDLIARMDKDAFAVLLTLCPAEVSRRIADRLETALGAFHFEWAGRIHPTRAHIGQVDSPPFKGTLDELLVAAKTKSSP